MWAIWSLSHLLCHCSRKASTDNMQLCYDKTLLMTSVYNLPAPELTPRLAEELEKPKKDPTGVATEHPVAPPWQAGGVGDKQPCSWAATVPEALLQSLNLKKARRCSTFQRSCRVLEMLNMKYKFSSFFNISQ